MGATTMTRLLAIWLLIWASVAISSPVASAAVTQDELTAAKELQQAKLDSVKELHQKDVDSLRQQLAAVDKRVDDQLTVTGQAIDRYGVATTWVSSLIGLMVTLLLVLVGFLGYGKAKSDAKEAAKEQAETSAKQWLDAQGKTLEKEIADLKQKALQIQAQMEHAEHEVKTKAESIKEEMDIKTKEAIGTLQTSIEKPSSVSESEQKKAQQVLQSRSEELQKPAELSRSFDDWNALAFAAHSAKKPEDAIFYWRKASEVPHAGAANVAQALLNRGVTQSELKQHEAETATYDELLRRFGDATEPELREYAVKALNNRGFNRLLLAKSFGPKNDLAKEHLRAALDDFNQAIACAAEPLGRVLGNRAYAQQLFGNTPQAVVDFAVALRVPEPGGQLLYEDTLRDLEINPIPEDAAMRELVEQAWSVYQQEQASNNSQGDEAPSNPH